MEFVPNRSIKQYTKLNKEIRVAIFDTGIDPLSLGLRECPDGSRKIIDCIDCTGSNDIDTSQSKPVIDGYVKSIIDRDIKINDQVSNVYIGATNLNKFISSRHCKEMKLEPEDINIYMDLVTYYINDKWKFIIELISANPILNGIRIELQEYNKDNKNSSIDIGSIEIKPGLRINFIAHNYINPESNRTSLVFDSGSHGTHVAGIVGAYFKSEPEKNGISPECKLLSLKIGDSRVEGMETSIAIKRALDMAVKYECQIINMSFGEPVSSANGKLIDICNEYIIKHNIIFCTSAGNAGPSINTIGAPATSSEHVFSVGAYIDNLMVETMYNTQNTIFEPSVYNWSSRGCVDSGSMGISILAPGGAITCVPEWANSYIGLKNGTSMSSPNCAGNIANILGNLQYIPYYHQVLRAIELTANKLNLETFSQAHGLINCSKAIDFLQNIQNQQNQQIINYSYNIDISIDGNITKGIKIINQINEYVHVSIIIKPVFQCVDNKNKYWSRSVTIDYPSSDKIKIDGPNKIILINDTNTIKIRIHKTQLAYVSDYIKILCDGLLETSIGINIFNPIIIDDIDNIKNYQLQIKPNIVERLYILPKNNMLLIDIDDKLSNYNEINNVTFEFNQLINSKSYKETNEYQVINKDSKKYIRYSCIPNTMIEICIYTPLMYDFTTSSININICSHNINIDISKYLLDYGETCKIYPSIDNKYLKNEKIHIQSTKLINKYYASGFKQMIADPRYMDKDLKALKKLILTYDIKYPETNLTYLLSSTNLLYESTSYQSGYMIGTYKDNVVFYSNYTEKTISDIVDKVYVIILDDKDIVNKNICVNVYKKYNKKDLCLKPNQTNVITFINDGFRIGEILSFEIYLSNQLNTKHTVLPCEINCINMFELNQCKEIKNNILNTESKPSDELKENKPSDELKENKTNDELKENKTSTELELISSPNPISKSLEKLMKKIFISSSLIEISDELKNEVINSINKITNINEESNSYINIQYLNAIIGLNIESTIQIIKKYKLDEKVPYCLLECIHVKDILRQEKLLKIIESNLDYWYVNTSNITNIANIANIDNGFAQLSLGICSNEFSKNKIKYQLAKINKFNVNRLF